MLSLFGVFIIPFNSSAQYPFEKYPAVKFKKYDSWHIKKLSDTTNFCTINIPDVFPDHSALSIKTLGDQTREACTLALYHQQKLIKKFKETIEISVPPAPVPASVFTEDLNNDGLKDIKILIPHTGGCGAFNTYSTIVYLFQQKDGSFVKISYLDWADSEDFENRVERDFNDDHQFEIITRTFKTYHWHNYQLFNIYNFNGKKLVNVNTKAGYPIMVQLLWDQNYEVAKNIPQKKINAFGKALPNSYRQE